MSDDIRSTSGIGTMAREIVKGTCHHYDWVNIGASVQHPENGKRIDLSEEVDRWTSQEGSRVIVYPNSGYGDIEKVREIIKTERPDAIMLFTDPRYWEWLFIHEREIRSKIPIIYLNIWDSMPYPYYNHDYYNSCDLLLAISKQTENINRIVLGENAKDKIIKYCPHGIDESVFYPITDKESDDYKLLKEFKKNLFNGNEYDFVMMFNSRNIRRKSFPDLLLAWKLFLDRLSPEERNKVMMIAHTQPIDDNGTHLPKVIETIWGSEDPKIVMTGMYKLSPEQMNLLYNCSDIVSLISSNEGWGLSLTEGMMAGRPIISNTTGGMQDQMRFEDENGNWISFNEEFGSNHFGRYKKCGEWAFPIFPSNISLIGSVPTPYIYDDRADFRDVSNSIYEAYKLGRSKLRSMGKKARKWVTSDESGMSSKNMAKNVIEGIDELFETWKPRSNYDFIKFEKITPKQNKYIIYE